MMKGIEGYRFKYTREWHHLTSTSCSDLILSTKLVRFIYDTITNNERVSRHYKSKKGPMSVCDRQRRLRQRSTAFRLGSPREKQCWAGEIRRELMKLVAIAQRVQDLTLNDLQRETTR